MIVRMSIDFAECDRARLARDAAYDGLFYTGVHYHGHLLPSGLSGAPRPIG
jgi:methylphosphotriester-DNA--protein-cysteine methyltransferase